MTKTANEIKAKSKNYHDRMQKFQENMDKHIVEHRDEIEQMIYEQRFKDDFLNGVKIHGYTWTQERPILKEKCFVTNELLLPFTKAYKGTKNHTNLHHLAAIDKTSFIRCPETIWLTKEEFTIRRLKGQI